MGIDRVLLEAMGVHARAAAATGQLAVSELAVSELVVSEEDCCDVLSGRTDGSLWHDLVERRAWSDERYSKRSRGRSSPADSAAGLPS